MPEKSSLSQQVEHAIKDEILSGKLAFGQRIDTDAMGRRWQISTTPIRDALRRLEQAWLVTVAPRRGFFVAIPDRQLLKDVFDLRMALERLAIESSARSIDTREIESAVRCTEDAVRVLHDEGDLGPLIQVDALVHELVLEHAGNRKLVALMDQLGDIIRLTRTLITRDRNTYEVAAAEHLTILRLLLKGDIEGSQRAMQLHLQNSFDRATTVWTEMEGGLAAGHPLARDGVTSSHERAHSRSEIATNPASTDR